MINLEIPFFQEEFFFYNIKFNKYHHTDQSRGSSVHYLAYMIKGEAKIVSKTEAIYVKPGDVFYIPKNLSYHSYWYGNDEVDFLSFGFANLQTSEKLNASLQVILCSDELKKKICAIPTVGTDMNCRTLSIFYDIMDNVVSLLKYSEQSNDVIILDRIKNTIQNNPHLSIPEIASLCSVSEPYVYYLFRKISRITPNTYRQKLLCSKAVELLLTTDKKSEEISDMLSFSSSSYFRKILKKHTGKTPRQIRMSGKNI